MAVPGQSVHIYRHGRLATFDASRNGAYGIVSDHALIVTGQKISAIVPEAELIIPPGAEVHHLQQRWVTPGFIDCHTHLVYGGCRVREWEQRLCGVPYAELARQGGGILSSVRSTRTMSEEELLAASFPRAEVLLREGVTCIEIKSGYGLSLDAELKQLRVARQIGERLPVDISPTLLAAHAVPPEYQGRADDYVHHICREIIPAVAEQKLAEAVDVFCEHIAFSVAQAERIWDTALRYGLAIKGHMEQLSNSGGTVNLAMRGGWSADHVEYLEQLGIDAMAKHGTVATLLPGAYYFLREKKKPPVEALRDAGVPLAVATDLNPGTSPFASIRLAMNMATVLFGLSPEEALLGTTRHAAKALGREASHGTLTAGKQADFLLWDIEHPAELVCSL
ncbi:MAG TPA: imidazolonepropionase, partial [Gemmatales bacterium]|nr:imidazolonepropionase [Gemmatales bacterium]